MNLETDNFMQKKINKSRELSSFPATLFLPFPHNFSKSNVNLAVEFFYPAWFKNTKEYKNLCGVSW